MRYEEIVERVRDRGGFEDEAEAARAIAATLATLRQRLVDDEAEAVARALPDVFAEILRRGAYEGDFDADELIRRVQAREAVPRAFAREHAQVVCQALADAMRGDALDRLLKHLPAELAELFAPRPQSTPPAAPERHDATPPGSGATLATGRPGSKRPLSEARPDRAHPGSVARSDAPHADTKLSSAGGLTQERLGETLATGKPGSTRPVHSTKR